MRSSPTFSAITVAMLLSSMFLGMIWAWAWAIRRYLQGRPLLPPATPRPVPWGPGSVFLVIFAWLAVNFGVTLGYMALTGDIPRPAKASAKPTVAAEPRKLAVSEQMLITTIANAVLIAAVPALLRMTSGARPSHLGIDRRGLAGQVRCGAMAFLLLTPAVYLINGLVVLSWSALGGERESHPLETMVLNDPSLGIKQLAILSAVLLAPATEELIFRGVVQGWLATALSRRRRKTSWEVFDDLPLDPTGTSLPEVSPLAPEAPDGPRWLPKLPRPMERWLAGEEASRFAPIVLTSGLFAVVHLPQWPAPVAIFFLALGLGAVYERTGSLVSSFVMHALFNGVATLLLFQAQPLKEMVDPKIGPPAGCVVAGSALERREADPGREKGLGPSGRNVTPDAGQPGDAVGEEAGRHDHPASGSRIERPSPAPHTPITSSQIENSKGFSVGARGEDC